MNLRTTYLLINGTTPMVIPYLKNEKREDRIANPRMGIKRSAIPRMGNVPLIIKCVISAFLKH
jgi:UDP-N-acetylmuramyl pentapeptide phosphotransferase/UDP-N-acetylglucosamine-1-phosphate transferase